MAGIDPSIPLQAKSPVALEGPMEMVGKAMQLKQLGLQGQHMGLENQMLGLNMQNQQAMQAALKDPSLRNPDGTIDTNKLLSTVPSPQGIAAAGSIGKAQGEAAKLTQTNQTMAFERNAKALTGIAALAQVQPTGTAADVANVHKYIDGQVQLGLLKPDEAAQIHSHVPANAAELPDYYRKSAMALATPILAAAGITGKIVMDNGNVVQIGQAPGMNPAAYPKQGPGSVDALPGSPPVAQGAAPAGQPPPPVSPTGTGVSVLATMPKQVMPDTLTKILQHVPGAINPDGSYNMANPTVIKAIDAKLTWHAPAMTAIMQMKPDTSGSFGGMSKDQLISIGDIMAKQGFGAARLGSGPLATKIGMEAWKAWTADQASKNSGVIPDPNVMGAVYHADKGSLAQATKTYDMIRGFEGTMLKNYDQLQSLFAKIPDTGSPWINKPLRDVAAGKFGDGPTAAAKFAIQYQIPEIVKLSSTMGGVGGVVSDEAKTKIEAAGINDSASMAGLKAIYEGVIKPDAKNRESTQRDIINQISSRMGGGSAPQAPALPPSKVNPANGKTYVLNPSDGKYYLPAGSK